MKIILLSTSQLILRKIYLKGNNLSYLTHQSGSTDSLYIYYFCIKQLIPCSLAFRDVGEKKARILNSDIFY